jgi:hypothetical protein
MIALNTFMSKINFGVNQRIDDAIRAMCGTENQDERFLEARRCMGYAKGFLDDATCETRDACFKFLDAEENDPRQFADAISSILREVGPL